MSFKDSMVSFINKMRQGPVVTDSLEANMANGGHTGWHPPVQPKAQKQDRQPGQMTGVQPAYDPNFYQNTGFQQPYQNGGQAPMYQQPQQTGYQPQGSWQGQQTGYQPQGSWQSGMQTGYQPQQSGWQGQQQTGYQPQGSWQGQQTGFQAGQGFGQQQGGFGQNAARQTAQADAAAYQTEGNVTYAFGQQFRNTDGTAYNHVERLAQPLSVSTCFRLIEFMRNGESIIVNLELISDENERSRCLDMLCGAAFTMQCTFTRVASRCIYLIAPHTVLVEPYESIRQMNEQDSERRWPRESADMPARPTARWSDRARRPGMRDAYAEQDERSYGYSR